jgi:hypothetical protein
MPDPRFLPRRDLLLGAGALGLKMAGPAAAMIRPPRGQTVWTFDRLDRIGGLPVRVEGQPTLITGPGGRAVLFDGVDDALFIDSHPLAGAGTFTFEAVFRPDGGPFEQRWFHLAESDPPAVPGAPAPAPSVTRFLFEIRVVEGGWYLDAFVRGPGYNKPLMAPDKLHPLGAWAHVAQTYDGQTYRSFVNGVLQAEAPIAFVAQGAGRASIGVRMNRVNYFRGAVREARFTPRALGPDDFSIPRQLNAG